MNMRDKFYPQTMTLRVPGLLARLVPSEVSKRNFIKKNGLGNENEFFNKMLPNMLAYRAYKKGFLREYLDKNIKTSIAEGMQEKILDFLAESFDYLYFDESEYECDDIINIRFDVKNEDLYAKLFSRLDSIGIKRSAYLRNLIHEYFNQSEYQKERICFNEEYNKLTEAIENEFILQFNVAGEIITALCAALEFSVRKEHWYLLYFKKDKFDTLYSIPIFFVKKIVSLEKTTCEPSSKISRQVNILVENGKFDEQECFILGGEIDA